MSASELSMTEQTAKKIAGNPDTLRLLARRQALRGKPHREGGSTIYEVEESWETTILREDPAVVTVTNSFMFEDAMNDPAVATIFIPRFSAMTAEVARRICHRHGLGKTIFLETGNGKNEQG